MTPECPDLERFVRGEIDATAFPHREHVRMAFEMLRRHDFAESVWHFSRTLRAMAARAGKPQAFHQTVTVAFLALIAERMERCGTADFAAFARAHPEMLDKRALARWYRPEQLATEVARRTFVLPESAARPEATVAPASSGSPQPSGSPESSVSPHSSPPMGPTA